MNIVMKRFALILSLITPSWAFAENYLCISEKVTGFFFENEQWKQANFVEEKFIINLTGSEIKITEFGKDYQSYTDCVEKLSGTLKDRFVCRSGFGEFYFNTKKKRYMRSYMAGYAEGDYALDTPLLAVGKCSKF